MVDQPRAKPLAAVSSPPKMVVMVNPANTPTRETATPKIIKATKEMVATIFGSSRRVEALEIEGASTLAICILSFCYRDSRSF